MIGHVLGKYRIEAELSRGGMGAVYRARHEIIERTVAIKLLRPEMTGSPELVTRFINEARAASAIRHPSIIEIFDFGHTEDGQAYLVMELLQGETLSARIAAKGRLGEGEAVKITRGIAGALAAAHAKGIIHRDLKPDNVFLVPDPDVVERAKVLDFGIAKLADHDAQSQTRTGALMGTPLYMAPEQARSAGAIDHRADLYSLGCILYELLTGKPPLVGDGAGEIIALHMFSVPEPPSTHVPGITPALEGIVMRLLEKEPAHRYSSAADVSNALADAFGASGIRPATPLPTSSARPAATAAPSVLARPAPRAANRLPWVAAGITLAIAAVIASVVVLGGNRDKPAPAPPPAVAPPRPARAAPTPPTPLPTPTPTPAPAPVQVVPAPTPAPPPPPADKRRTGTRPKEKKALPQTDKSSPVETSI